MKAIISTAIGVLMVCAACAHASNHWYYSFDGTCHDSGSNGQDGSASAGVVFQTGHKGQCASFSGADYVSLPLDFSETAELSVAFWLKAEGRQPGPYYAMVISSDANTYGRGFALNLEDNDYQVWLDDRVVNTGLPVADVGQWQHVCLTYAPGAVKLYLDGREAYAYADYTNALPYLDGTNLLVGLRNLFFDRGLNASVDELHIYDRTLSVEEVVQLAGEEPGLLAHYMFEGNLKDCSSNAFHGTPSGTLSYEASLHGRGLVLPPAPYVRLPINLNSYGSMSFSFWMKVNGALSNPEYGMFFSTDNNTFGRGLGVNAGDNRFMVWHDDNFEYLANTLPPVGVWKHVGVTYEPGRACFYIDGQCVRTNTQHKNTPPYNDATTVTLGIRNLFLDRGANFSIDELRIYNRTLASNEMQSVFGLGLAVTGLVVEGSAVIGPNKTTSFSCFAYSTDGQRLDVTPGATFRIQPAGASNAAWFAGNVLHSGAPAFDTACQVVAVYEHVSGIATSAPHDLLVKADDGDCLLAYYPLDGNAFDASGNALDGTVSGAVVSTDAVAGACFSFNGRNTVVLPVDLNSHADMSYSLWFKIMGTQPGPYYAMLLSSDRNTWGRGISITLTNSDFLLWFDDSWADTSVHTPTVGEWHHLAATYTPGDNVFYFDGIERYRDRAHAGRPPYNDATNLLLGMRNLFFDRGFNGKIDEVKIFRCALSSNAVWDIYADIAGDKINRAPVIRVVPDPPGGVAPCKITFDFAGSYDPDGVIVRSEVDRDGDGSFERSVEGAGRLTVDYPRPGSYQTCLRVVDNFGAMAGASVQIAVGGTAPEVDLQAEPASGPAPLEVAFAAHVTLTSSNYPVACYEWDYNGDGAPDEISAVPQIRHVYGAAGEYVAGVSVIDAAGVMGRGARRVTVEPPVAPPACDPALEFFPPAGFSPLAVELRVLNAGACDYTAIEWDCDGDGRVDVVSTNPAISHVYGAPGKYWPAAGILFADGSRIARSNLLQVSESSDLRVWISQPRDGQVLQGDAIALHANTAPGRLTRSVQFQYRPAAASEWTVIGDWIDAPPYSFVAKWDVSAFPAGAVVFLRAVARDTRDDLVCSDTVQVQIAGPVETNLNAVQAVGSRLEYHVDTMARCGYRFADGFEFSIAPFTVPANRVLSIQKDAVRSARAPAAAGGKEFLPETYRLDFGPAAFSQPIQLLLPYADADDDGLVDGTTIPEATLNAYGCDEARATWQAMIGSDVDPVLNRVRTRVAASCAVRLAGNPSLLQPPHGCTLVAGDGDAPQQAIDGNNLSCWRAGADQLPAEIVWEFTNRIALVAGVSILNTGGASNEPLRTFRLDLSLDGVHYSPYASGVLAGSDDFRSFETNTVVCRYVKLVVEDAGSAAGATLNEICLRGSLAADADRDGLGDDWENQCFGSLTNEAAPDRDGDGHSNFEEFIAGTDAADSDSKLSLAVACPGETASFRWDAREHRSYTIFWATNLLAPAWQPIVTDSTAGALDVDATDFPEQGFFKISVRFQ